jgi:hypothetical protein
LNNFYASYFGCFLIPRKQLKWIKFLAKTDPSLRKW